MAERTLLQETKTEIRSLLLTETGPFTMDRLSKLYLEMIGKHIPFSKLGYPSLIAFLNSIPDTVIVDRQLYQVCVWPVLTQNNLHMAKLVQEQKKRSSGGHRRKGRHSGQSHGFSDNINQTSVNGRKEKSQPQPFQFQRNGARQESSANCQFGHRQAKEMQQQRRPSLHDRQSNEQINKSQPATLNAQFGQNKLQSNQSQHLKSANYRHQPNGLGGRRQNGWSASAAPFTTHRSMIPSQYHASDQARSFPKTNSDLFVNGERPCANNGANRGMNNRNMANNGNGATAARSYREASDNSSDESERKPCSSSNSANIIDDILLEFASVVNLPSAESKKSRQYYGLAGSISTNETPSTPEEDQSIQYAPSNAKFKHARSDHIFNGAIDILSIASPYRFWFHALDQSEALEELMDTMSRFYNHTEQPSMVQNDIRPGRICAVLYDDEWYRAEISAAPISDQVDVLLVDYAIQRIVRTDVIKYLRDDFVRMPVFALCGCLSGLRPFGAQWTETSLEAFAELIENKILHAEVKEYEQLKHKYHMYLVVHGEPGVTINNLLITLGFARTFVQ